MTAAQLRSIPQTRAYRNAMRQARRICSAKDKARATHTWAKHMHKVIVENASELQR
jgi:hypothetical protein